jgi:hypothetical protein
LSAVSVTLDPPLPPCTTVTEVGFAEIEKSGGG